VNTGAEVLTRPKARGICVPRVCHGLGAAVAVTLDSCGLHTDTERRENSRYPAWLRGSASRQGGPGTGTGNKWTTQVLKTGPRGNLTRFG
jgi:hypothetical protein